jgi:hypothetical protein
MTCTRLHQPQLLHAILITWKSLHFVTLLYTHVTKDCVIFKANLENYDGLIDPKGHVQNIISILKLVTTKSDDICKISLQLFLDLLGCGIIALNLGLQENYMKLVFYFSTNSLFKKSTTKLFVIT